MNDRLPTNILTHLLLSSLFLSFLFLFSSHADATPLNLTTRPPDPWIWEHDVQAGILSVQLVISDYRPTWAPQHRTAGVLRDCRDRWYMHMEFPSPVFPTQRQFRCESQPSNTVLVLNQLNGQPVLWDSVLVAFFNGLATFAELWRDRGFVPTANLAVNAEYQRIPIGTLHFQGILRFEGSEEEGMAAAAKKKANGSSGVGIGQVETS